MAHIIGRSQNLQSASIEDRETGINNLRALRAQLETEIREMERQLTILLAGIPTDKKQ